jgi:hypothetical protein
MHKSRNKWALESKDAEGAVHFLYGFEYPWPFFDPSDFLSLLLQLSQVISLSYYFVMVLPSLW